MSRFVLDCSIAMNWCFEDESQLIADHVLDRLFEDEALVPAVWLLEVVNILLVGERKGRITSAQASHFLAMLETLPILIDLPASLKTMDDIYSLAGTYQLSAYDAAYLELAMREKVVLATLDESLSAAAVKAGVSVLKITT
ncbi:MAG: type II toxin-antitoxin system VapC family toxin [Thermoguttaceae bacterium]|jgi:predicted nucleic acid-binding protein